MPINYPFPYCGRCQLQQQVDELNNYFLPQTLQIIVPDLVKLYYKLSAELLVLTRHIILRLNH
jgi:hypothetical protein